MIVDMVQSKDVDGATQQESVGARDDVVPCADCSFKSMILCLVKTQIAQNYCFVQRQSQKSFVVKMCP